MYGILMLSWLVILPLINKDKCMSEQLVKFDPSNPQHVEAYLCIRLHGKQHPTLRFELDEDFQSVPGMTEVS